MKPGRGSAEKEIAPARVDGAIGSELHQVKSPSKGISTVTTYLCEQVAIVGTKVLMQQDPSTSRREDLPKFINTR